MNSKLGSVYNSTILAKNHRFSAIRYSHTQIYAALRFSKINDFWCSLANCKQTLAFLFVILFPSVSSANLDLITWKGVYYHAVPNRKGVAENYCKDHTPGAFIHVVKDALLHPIITNKGIKLEHASFNIDKIDGIYLIHGSFLATGKSNGIQWQDHIYYYLYKFTEAGVTKGIWYSKDCKGLYKGIAINNKNPHHIK